MQEVQRMPHPSASLCPRAYPIPTSNQHHFHPSPSL